jgi:hypothetical protein
MKLKERIVLKKYNGDLPKDGEDKEPIEIIVVEDGKIISREEY